MASHIRQILRVAIRWAGAWTALGLVAGVVLMFAKAPFLAESGARPTSLSFYATWIPFMGFGGAAFGLFLGLIFAALMALTERWRTPAEAKPGIVRRHGPRLLCGAAAGGVIGLALSRDST